jgi:radical SAM protein with 4Fe4S-binding SPASM domain
MSYDYNSWEPNKISVGDLTEDEIKLLRDSKTFCMYPWVHIHSYPTGETYPCCVADMEHPVGSVNEQPLSELINSPSMKSLRQDMLNGVKRQECKKCYEQDETGFFSSRTSANKHWGHYINKVHDTNPDGSIDNFEMKYLDVRFSNLCNLKCRSCGHIFSSQWHKDQIKVTQQGYWEKVRDPSWPEDAPTTMEEFRALPQSIQDELMTDFHGEIISHINYGKQLPVLNVAGRHENDLLEQVLDHIDTVEQIYFAGGEPLVMEQHYTILKTLIEHGRTDVRLQYNTNLTKVKLKDMNAFDMWKHFSNVSIGASLDGMGEYAEYIRTGTKWADVERYRIQMMEECPHIDFYISPTLSIMNALHLPDFHRAWVDKGFIKPQDVNVNILQFPLHYRLDVATPEYKQLIRDKFNKHLEWLKPYDTLNRASTGYQAALNIMEQESPVGLAVFWEKVNLLDKIRNENILDFIPEMKLLK